MADNWYLIIRVRRISPDLPAGTTNLFSTAGGAASFFWGKNVKDYLLIKNGDAVPLANGNLVEIEEYIENFVSESSICIK